MDKRRNQRFLVCSLVGQKSNKRGDITITILVIGIIAVCFLALISFYLASLSTDEGFNKIGKIVEINSNMEKYLSGKSIRVEPPDASGKSYLYDSIKSSTGFLGLGGTKTFFEIKYYLSGTNPIVVHTTPT